MYDYMTDHYSPPSRDSLYFSSHVPTQIMGGLALPGLLYLSFLLYTNASISYYFFPATYILLSPIAWYYFSFMKTKQHLDDTEFQELFERAMMRIGILGTPQLFLDTEKKTLLNNARTPFLRGLLVSEKAEKLIVQHPSEGEIVLAHELALLKRDHLWLSFLRNNGAAFYALVTEGVMLFSIMEPLLPSLYQIPLWIIAILITYPWGIVLFIWYHRKSTAENEIESIYGMNPHLATFQVFSNQRMSTAGRRFYIDEIESHIELRRSRTIAVSLGIPIVVSLALSTIVYILFFLYFTPLVFIEFAALLLGGISFSFGVYHYESKGTRGLKKPHFESNELPRINDELSIEVEKLLCMKVNTNDCTVRLCPQDSLEDEEDLDYYQAKIAYTIVFFSQEEVDILSDPDLISSYISGSYTEKISGNKNLTYVFVLLCFLVQLLGGSLWLVIILRTTITIIIAWIIFSCVLVVVLLFGVNSISLREKIKALKTLSKIDKNYIVALKKLDESETKNLYLRNNTQRLLKRLTSKLNSHSNDFATSN